MNTRQRHGKFASAAICLTLSAGISACSSSEGSVDTAAGTGGGGAPGAGGGTGGDTKGGSKGAGGASASMDVVGTFQVQMQVDRGTTRIVGQVADGPPPPNLVWTVIKEEGPCRLETPSAPFCDGGCGADVCVADGVCQAYPVAHDVGAVTLTGVKLEDGSRTLVLKEIAKAYQPPAGTVLAYPSFAATDTIVLNAAGGDYPGFELSAPGVDPIVLSTTDFALDPSAPFTLAWDAPEAAKAARIHVKLDLSHHGGVKGLLECDADDTGSLTISREMLSQLMGLGVAGYPSVVLTRSSTDTVAVGPGLVRLDVSSSTERLLTTPGVTSCTADTDCAEGATCQSDSTCQP